MARESIAAVLITQGEHRFYTATVTSDLLAKICYMVNRFDDPIEGFQRYLSDERAQDIADYIDNGFGTIPVSVILSAQKETDFKYDSKSKTISFKADKNSFLILDGQHRVYGFAKAKSKLRVPVVIYSDLSRSDETRLFIDINTKQRPVPNELLLDIKRLADLAHGDEQFLLELFDIFSAEKNSSLLGLTSAAEKKSGKVSRVTFKAALGSVLPDLSKNSPQKVYEVLNPYVQAFKNGCGKLKAEESFTNPIVFGASMLTFPEVLRRHQDKFGTVYKTSNFEACLEPLFENIKSSQLKKPGTSRRGLYEIFSKTLRGRINLEL